MSTSKRVGVTKNWYSLDRIRSYDTAYRIIFGERKNGKTYAAKRAMVECAVEGRQFMYVRRRHSMITYRKMLKLFDDMEDYCVEKLGSVVNYNIRGEFYITDTEGNQTVIGYTTSIEDAYDDKGIPFNKVKLVVFDEFIDYTYMEDEIALFIHTIANIVRDEERQEVEIIMLGNTIRKHCPYFEYFGINVNKLRKGDVAVITGPNGGTAVVEYTRTRSSSGDKVKKSKYFGFGGGESDMVLHGAWEYKACNTTGLDGVTWSAHRTRVHAYVSALEAVYEMSFYLGGYSPILFVRTINTQNGVVSKYCRVHLTYDNSLSLVTHAGVILPTFRHVNKYVDKNVTSELKMAYECLAGGRVVFQNEQIGTEFTKIFPEIMRAGK